MSKKRTKTIEVKEPKKRAIIVVKPPKKRLAMNHAMFAPESNLRPKYIPDKPPYKRKPRNQKGGFED